MDLPVHIWYDGMDAIEDAPFTGGALYVRDDGIPTLGMIDWLVRAADVSHFNNDTGSFLTDDEMRASLRACLYRAAGEPPSS